MKKSDINSRILTIALYLVCCLTFFLVGSMLAKHHVAPFYATVSKTVYERDADGNIIDKRNDETAKSNYVIISLFAVTGGSLTALASLNWVERVEKSLSRDDSCDDGCNEEDSHDDKERVIYLVIIEPED